MTDVFLWGMILFSLVYHFMTHKNENIKNILTIVIPFVVMQYCVALFPSFQIGLGIMFLSLFIALVFRDKIKFFNNKRQIIRTIIIIVLSIVLVGYFVITCKDALKLLMNTIYPGRRAVLGGDYFVRDLFTDLTTPFTPYVFNKFSNFNHCEASTYIHFGMFALMLSPLLISDLRKKGNKDYLIGIILSIIVIIYGSFMIFGFPKWLAKITLFSYINRMKMILGFIMVIYTIWTLNSLKTLDYKVDKKYYFLCVFSYCFLLLSFVDESITQYLPVYVYYAEIVMYGLILLFIINKRTDYAYSILIALVVFSSIAVNPIVKGISSLENIKTVSAIKQIVSEDKNSYWFANGNDITYGSFLLSNGVKVINGINFYPDLKKWKIIDSNNEFEDIWNRYGYILGNISYENKNNIDCNLSQDVISLEISLKKLDELNVKYIFSKEDISNISYDGYYLEEIYSDEDNVKIYKLLNKNN